MKHATRNWVIRIIRSCKTLGQLNNTLNLINLFLRNITGNSVQKKTEKQILKAVFKYQEKRIISEIQHPKWKI